MSSHDIFPEKSDDFELLNYNKDYWTLKYLSDVSAYISYRRAKCHRVYHMDLKDGWQSRWQQHFERLLKESHEENGFETKDRMDWNNVERRLDRDPRRGLNNADLRLLFRLDNMYLVKHGFTFGQWLVDPGHQHVIQTSFAPMLYYELIGKDHPSDVTIRRKLSSRHCLKYERFILPPHGIYRVPEGTRYVLMAVQKTLFALNVIDKNILAHGSRSCRLIRKYARQEDIAPPPTPLPSSDEKKRSSSSSSHPSSSRHSQKKDRSSSSSRNHKKRPASAEWGSFKIPKKTMRQESVDPAPTPEELMPSPPLAQPQEPEFSMPPQPEEPEFSMPPQPQEPEFSMPEEPEFQTIDEQTLQDFLNDLPNFLRVQDTEPVPIPVVEETVQQPPVTVQTPQVGFDMVFFEDNPWTGYVLPQQPTVLPSPTVQPTDDLGHLYLDPPQTEPMDLSMPTILQL